MQLSNAVAECPKSELKAIGGDFNTRLLESTVEEEGRVIGECGFGSGDRRVSDFADNVKDNRDRLIKLCWGA